MESMAFEWLTAWNKRLLPGNSGNNILFIVSYIICLFYYSIIVTNPPSKPIEKINGKVNYHR